MTSTWLIVSIVLPAASAAAAAFALKDRDVDDTIVIALNAAMPGSGLAAAGRPLLEVLGCLVLAQAGLLTIGRPDDLGYWVPIAIIGGVWASCYTRFNPITLASTTTTTTTTVTSPASGAPGSPRAAGSLPGASIRGTGGRAAARSAAACQSETEADPSDSYTVEVRCTECGADVEVPVLSHMAHCQYCGSRHLVVGTDHTLQLSLPERITDRAGLREAVLDHYRYVHYLKLYQRKVTPLQGGALSYTVDGTAVDRPEMDAAIAAAEAHVSAQADAYRRRLAEKLEVAHEMRFLAPYRHGMGTLYQAAFGRDPRSHDKRLRFAIGTLEASICGSDLLDLPTMGKLSYLRALEPAVKHAGTAKVLPLVRSDSDLEAAYGELNRKQLVRDLQVIRLGSVFAEEVTAVVWRPWWITEARGPGFSETLLVDSMAGTVAGPAPFLNPEILEELPPEAAAQGSSLAFLPMECPECGNELTFRADAALHFCQSCHRLCEVAGGRKRIRPYDHIPMPPGAEADLVPFWRFPLSLRTADGELLTDLLHLKDGIDGTFDQIGDDAPIHEDVVYIPAIRCINARLMARAFNRLFLYALKARLRPREGPIALDLKPRPLDICVVEDEARRMAPLCLANAFGQRDLARVNVHQIAAWLLDARLESRGRLTFLPVPLQVTNPFRSYVGRSRGQALDQAAGTA